MPRKVEIQTYLVSKSASLIIFPSTMVKAPMPGRTKDLRISVPKVVALTRHTWQESNLA